MQSFPKCILQSTNSSSEYGWREIYDEISLRHLVWWILSAVNIPLVLSVQSCPTLCDPINCSLPSSCVHGIFQARILEWVAIFSSRGSFWPRDQTCVSCIFFIGRRTLYHWDLGRIFLLNVYITQKDELCLLWLFLIITQNTYLRLFLKSHWLISHGSI